jgi:NADH:ubiquinone oxidoreductase subunit K
MIEFLAGHKPTTGHWLVFTAVLFAIGLYGMLSRRNAVGVLMAVEIMLNAAVLNFVIFNKFISPATVDGQIMALFAIAVAAAEVVVGIAIFVAIFRYRSTIDVNSMNTMKD